MLLFLGTLNNCGLIIYRIDIASTATEVLFIRHPVASLVRYMKNIACTAAIDLFVG